ncbi:hypothetical protein B1R94_02245 [Mycolicibacterium litorale]|nr:hypothetical protein B1R94_02245 [Mycolicibacterium litorale]
MTGLSAEAADTPSPRTPMLAVVDQLTKLAADARVDAGAARADGDQERRQYLMGEHRGLMEAAEALLAFDWTAAWRESMTITTVEQLDALPSGSVIRRGGFTPGVFERAEDCELWLEAGSDSPDYPGEHLLPAILVWHPDWSDQ